MRRSWAVLASVALLAVPLLRPVPAGADVTTCTAPELITSSVLPQRLQLGTSVPGGLVTTVGVRKNGCSVTAVDTRFSTPTGSTDEFAMEEVETADGVTTYAVGIRFDPGSIPDADAGRWTPTASASWNDRSTSAQGVSFQVLRAARLSTDATPEPVSKGKTITVRGTLKRADWATLQDAAYPGRRVELQFRTSGGTYRTVTSATTGRNGKIAVKVRASRDGCYRFAFRGSSTTAKVVSRGDCVDVR